jgi:putative zinc finger/helix-turn-helix YgiT family protein
MFTVPELQVNKCDACGEVFFDAVTDDQISQALRKHLGLLSPQHIRERLNVLGLKQKEFGERIGVAPETISRWLSGTYIQSRAMDNLMRMFFEREEAKFNPLESGYAEKEKGTVTSDLPSTPS